MFSHGINAVVSFFFHFQSWHKQGCFTCKDCNKSLDSNTVAERKAEDGDVGEVYCKGQWGQKVNI